MPKLATLSILASTAWFDFSVTQQEYGNMCMYVYAGFNCPTFFTIALWWILFGAQVCALGDSALVQADGFDYSCSPADQPAGQF
jgi:hypothetical protein